MNDRPTYIASCSFGKDSLATILLALEHNEPLDRAVFCEVMFDHERGISGELPEHIEWVYSVAIPKLESMGVKVDVVRPKKDYTGIFYTPFGCKTKHPERIGKYYGWLLAGRCLLCKAKTDAIRKHLKKYDNIVQYVGIALDEPTRLARLGDNKLSLLAKYNYTEKMALELCDRYDLLSPIYQYRVRNGCWFCPNCPPSHFARLRRQHPKLWQELETFDNVDNKVGNYFSYTKTLSDIRHRMDEIDRRLDFEERQLRLF